MNRVLALLLVGILVLAGFRDAMAFEVALIGDNAKQAAFEQLAREFNAPIAGAGDVRRAATADGKVAFTVANAGRDPVAAANQLLRADLALLVVDATQGPLPIVREHVIVARQANVPLITVYFARTQQLSSASPKDSAELLELEEMEMRELLSLYKVGGDKTPVFRDSADGIPALRRFLASRLSSRTPVRNLQTINEFAGTFYLLTEPEGREHNRAITVANDTPLDVWIAGSLRAAVVRTKDKHAPGDAADLTLKLQSPTPAAEGLRLLLLRDGMVVGVGVIAQIVR